MAQPHARCRLCGAESQMTREHTPPKSTGNRGRMQVHSLDDLVLDRPFGTVDDGIAFPSLCEDCNARMGRYYCNHFRDWTDQLACRPLAKGERRRVVSVRFRPLAILKELAVMALAAAPEEFVDSPIGCELRRFSADTHEQELPRRLRFYMYLADSSSVPRLARGVCVADLQRRGDLVLLEVAVPPVGYAVTCRMAHMLSLASRSGLLDITWFKNYSGGQWDTLALELPVKSVLGGWPLDYRSREQVLTDAAREIDDRSPNARPVDGLVRVFLPSVCPPDRYMLLCSEAVKQASMVAINWCETKEHALDLASSIDDDQSAALAHPPGHGADGPPWVLLVGEADGISSHCRRVGWSLREWLAAPPDERIA